MIIELLLRNVDEIFGRITLSQLSRYDKLQRSLCAIDVAADQDYQRTFNGYYRMQRRTRDWYGYFSRLLEREKKNRNITFREVLEETYATKCRVEPSFSSKLIATIRPELPIYDKYVRENLLLSVPRQHSLPRFVFVSLSPSIQISSQKLRLFFRVPRSLRSLGPYSIGRLDRTRTSRT